MNRYLALTLSLISSLLITHAAQAACIDWHRVMGTLPFEHQGEGPVFVVQQFHNATQHKEDKWLETGYRDLIAMLLSTVRRARVRSGDSARYDAAAQDPAYIIGGRIFRMPAGLRMIIELANGRTKEMEKIFTLNTPYPDNAAFFSETANAVRAIARLADLKIDDQAMDRMENATPSTNCFENYERGMQILRTYDPSKYDVAAVWFGEAKKADVHSWLGYEGMIELYALKGLMAKQAGRPFVSFYQQAEQEAVQQYKIAKRPPPVPPRRARVQKKSKGGIPLTNRYLRSHTAYMSGVAALQGGNAENAVEFLQNAVKEVPEDAMAWQALAQAYASEGKSAEANTARSKARSINSCS